MLRLSLSCNTSCSQRISETHDTIQRISADPTSGFEGREPQQQLVEFHRALEVAAGVVVMALGVDASAEGPVPPWRKPCSWWPLVPAGVRQRRRR